MAEFFAGPFTRPPKLLYSVVFTSQICTEVVDMPKMKTRKAVAKRVKITARGKVMRGHPGAGHLKSRKSPKRIRRFRTRVVVASAFAKQAKRHLCQ